MNEDTPPQDDREAPEQIRGFALANRIRYSGHSRKRMRERGVRDQDVRRALCNLRKWSQETSEKWLVTGPDLDGDDLTMVLVIDDGVLIVTVGLD